MKLIFACLLIAFGTSGCGIARVAVEGYTNPIGTASYATGAVITSGFMAAMPNQGMDED